MASDITLQNVKQTVTPAVPFPPSWVDRLTAWIAELPGPSWLYYLALFLVELALVTIPRGLSRGDMAQAFDPFFASFAVFNVYFIALIHYLDFEAELALKSFRPAIDVNDAEYGRLCYEITTMPERGVWIASVIGAVLGLLVILLNQTLVRVEFAAAPFATILLAIILDAGFAMAAVFLYHTIRQLRLVSRMYHIANKINLFQIAPLHAFPRLTARTAVGYILVVYLANLVRPEVTLTNPALVSLMVFQLLVAVACFVVPLLGMHSRMVVEKEHLLAQANRRIEAMIEELYRRADTGTLTDVDRINALIGSLVTTRDVIAKIPTWPWQPGTLTGFVTALLLPFIFWVITRILERFL